MSAEYTVHVLAGPGGMPRCGADGPGPIPWGQVNKILPCLDCMTVGAEGLPREATMRYKLEEVRRDLARKLRGMSAADRADYKLSVFSAAASSLADPDRPPTLFDEGQMMAALYAIDAIRAAYIQMRRAGVRPPYSMLEQGAHEMEMIVVALADGTPQ